MIARRRLEEVRYIESEPDQDQRRDQDASADHQNSFDDLNPCGSAHAAEVENTIISSRP